MARFGLGWSPGLMQWVGGYLVIIWGVWAATPTPPERQKKKATELQTEALEMKRGVSAASSGAKSNTTPESEEAWREGDMESFLGSDPSA